MRCGVNTGPIPSEVSLRRELNSIKRERFAWMYDVGKAAVQEAIIDLGAAFRAFFEKRAEYPRFKRKDDRQSFCAANEAGTFRADGNRIKLPVIGWVCMREEVRFSGTLKRATVSCEAGRWFVALQIDTDDVKPVAQPEAVVGVDLGVSALATLSTGEVIEGPSSSISMTTTLRCSCSRLEWSCKCRRRDRRGRAYLPTSPSPRPKRPSPPSPTTPSCSIPRPASTNTSGGGPQA
jgi:putative transposase